MASPVCKIPTTTPITQPVSPTIPAIPMPTANGPLGMLPTVMALKKAVEILSGQKSTNNTAVQGFKVTDPDNKKSKQQGRWVEISRETANVTIYNPNDNTQFVVVNRINKLTFQDSVTGETWTWSR